MEVRGPLEKSEIGLVENQFGHRACRVPMPVAGCPCPWLSCSPHPIQHSLLGLEGWKEMRQTAVLYS